MKLISPQTTTFLAYSGEWERTVAAHSPQDAATSLLRLVDRSDSHKRLGELIAVDDADNPGNPKIFHTLKLAEALNIDLELL